MMNKPRIVITGGHLTPALALIEVLKNKDWEIVYFGRMPSGNDKKVMSSEQKIVTDLGVTYIAVTAGKLHRKLTWDAVVSLLNTPLGVVHSIYLLMKLKPVVVMSFGGYLGLPTIIGAWMLRIPRLIHEQTTVAGLANRITAWFSNIVTISFPVSERYFPLKKTALTGNPVQTGLFTINNQLEKEVCKGFKNSKTILVMCGNQGSKQINQAVLECLPQLVNNYNLIHVIGSSTAQEPEWQKAQKIQESLPIQQRGSYVPLRYVHPDQRGAYFQVADLVVSRSGANTIYDLGLLNKPALLIPLEPSLMNEQMENARMLENQGLAMVLRENELNVETLEMGIKKAFENLNSLRLKASATDFYIVDGANNLYEIVEMLRSGKQNNFHNNVTFDPSG